MKRRGRPVLGAISGFFLGVFMAIDLALFGIRPLDNLSFFGLPLLGLALGLGLALWAPFGRKRAQTAPAAPLAGPRPAPPAGPPPDEVA